MSGSYFVKPRATLDVENQGGYYAIHFGMETTHRFIQAAHETYALLARYPKIGWAPRFGLRTMKVLRVFRVNGFAPMLILYRPLENGVEILRVVHGSRNLRALFRQPEEIE